MTKDEAIKTLQELNARDQEAAHMQAEDAMLAVMRAHGLADVATAFEEARDRIGFWYA